MTHRPLDPRAMSDEELQAACAPRRWETYLERIGSGAASVLAIFATVVIVQFLRPHVGPFLVLMAGILTFGAVLGGLASWVWSVAGARRRPFRAELDRRHGMAPHATYLEEDRAAFPPERAPGYTLLLTTTALPSGGHRWVRVHLWNTPQPRAHVEVRTARWRHGSTGIPTTEMTRGEAELGEALRLELLALLETPGPAALASVQSNVKDGMPCALTVLDRVAERVHEGSCNLAGVCDTDRDHPSVRFVQAVLRAGAAVPAPELMTGWCDEQGNIGIGAL